MSDDVLLKELNGAMAECEESAAKLESIVPKKVTINEASTSLGSSGTQDVAATLKPLAEGMPLLQQQLKEMKTYNNNNNNHNNKKRDTRCHECKDKRVSTCSHCFKCGETNHMMRNRTKN